MKLIFLDIDGVLNTHEPLHPEVLCGRIYREKIDFINLILKETGAKIVLSSAWRYLIHRKEMNLEGLNWLFRSHGLYKDSIIGITREDTLHNVKEFDGKYWPITNERGAQISDYLFDLPYNQIIDKYIVVDDLDLGIKEAGHPYLFTDPTIGLTERQSKAIIKWLNGNLDWISVPDVLEII